MKLRKMLLELDIPYSSVINLLGGKPNDVRLSELIRLKMYAKSDSGINSVINLKIIEAALPKAFQEKHKEKFLDKYLQSA